MTTDTNVDVMAALDVIDHCAKIIGETGYPHSEAALNKAREAIRDLVETVGPFDCLLQDHHERHADDTPLFAVNGAQITFGDLRKLRAALQKFAGV